jgi:hypothetical protein
MNEEMKRLIDLLGGAGYVVRSIGKPPKSSLLGLLTHSFSLEIEADDPPKEEARREADA